MTLASNPSGIPDDECLSRQQLTTPIDDRYAALIGRATYAWTYLEWQVVCVGEKVSPGFAQAAAELTAGSIGNALTEKLKTFAGDVGLVTELSVLAAAFMVLVKRRNKLLHAHPATLTGKQRLRYWSPKQDPVTGTNVFDWDPDEIVSFTHEVETMALEGNRLYYDTRMSGTAWQIVP